MKISYFYFTVLVLTALLVMSFDTGNDNVIKSWEPHHLRGRVRSIIEWRYHGSDKNAEETADREAFFYYYYYDTQGHLTSSRDMMGIRQFTYDAHGDRIRDFCQSDSSVTFYYYDDRHHAIKDSTFRLDGSLYASDIYLYDAWGNCIQWDCRNPDTKKLYQYFYGYDSLGRNTEFLEIDCPDGKPSAARHRYDERGNMIQTYFLVDTGSVQIWTGRRYDEHDEVIYSADHDLSSGAGDKVTHEGNWELTYDKTGNWIRKVSSDGDKDGIWIRKRLIAYY